MNRILIVMSFLSLSAFGGDWEQESFHLDAGNQWREAANEQIRYVAKRVYSGAQAHINAREDIATIGRYLEWANEHFAKVNQYRRARKARQIGLLRPPLSVGYLYTAEPTYYRTYSTLAASAGLGTTSSATSSAERKSSDKDWKFVGCYSQSAAHDRCRARFENDKWCHDSYLGTAYECLPQEKTAPRACYCWQ